jgi:hypothetical protein
MENMKKESPEPHDMRKIAMCSYHVDKQNTGFIDRESCFSLLCLAVRYVHNVVACRNAVRYPFGLG